MDANLRTITVAELIEKLQDQDPEAKVIFSADYGDRGRTQQALAIKGEIDTVCVRESGYSSSGFSVVENDDEDPGCSDDTYVLIG